MMKQRIDNVLKNTRFSRWEVVISDLVDSFPELTVVFIIIHCSVAKQEILKKNIDSMSKKLHRRHFITPKYCNRIIVKLPLQLEADILKALLIIKLKSYLYCNIRVNKIITATIIVSNRCTPNLRSLMKCFSITVAFRPPGTGIYVLIRFQNLAFFAQKSRERSNEITVGRSPLIFNYC